MSAIVSQDINKDLVDNEDNNNEKTKEGSEKKQIIHVPPRVDPEYYQAEVQDDVIDLPYEKGEALKFANTNWYNSTRSISTCHPTKQEKIAKFLAASRNIFEPLRVMNDISWNSETSAIPMESDALAIEYLARYDYNVDEAMFKLSCELGFGKDLVNVSRNKDLVDRFPIVGTFVETKDRVLRTAKIMHGAYMSSESSLRGHNNDGQLVSSLYNPSTSTTKASFPITSIIESSNYLDSPSTSNTIITNINSDLRNYSSISFPRSIGLENVLDVKPFIEKKPIVEKVAKEEKAEKGTGRSRGQDKDKLDNRNRWHAVQKRLSDIQSSTNSKNRVSSIEAQAVLEEILYLPPYQNTPGDDFNETMRPMIGEVYKLLLTSREWVAIVHDELHPQQHNKAKKSTLADLERLLKSGSEIKIQAPEELILKDIIKDGIEIRQECKKLLLGFNCSNGDNDSSDDGKDRKKLSHVVKVPIDEVNTILVRSEKIPVIINEVQQLLLIFNTAMDLSTRVYNFLETINICKHRKPKPMGVRDAARSSLSDIDALYSQCMLSPISIPLTKGLAAVLFAGIKWQEEVLAMSGNNTEATSLSTSSNRSSRGVSASKAAAVASIGNNNKPASLKRVEQLLIEGEKMPFDFNVELEILKDKRVQAKQWLEKLKNSFPKAGGSRVGSLRKNDGNDIKDLPINSGEKLDLADMKLIVREGEELFDDETNNKNVRELTKAQSVVEMAEEWLERVRDAITETIEDENEEETALGEQVEAIEMLQDLLDEADNMPVNMDECQVLRSHLQSLEWRTKARPILLMPKMVKIKMTEVISNTSASELIASTLDNNDGNVMNSIILSTDKPIITGAIATSRTKKVIKPRLVEVQKLAKEITRIRGNVSQAIWEAFPIKPLIEETFCLQTVALAETWIAKVKKMIVNNTIKKGYSLSSLREIYANGLSIPVNLDYELRPIKTAIQIAETWLKENIYLFKKIGINIINLPENQDHEENSDHDNDHDNDHDKEKDDSIIKTNDFENKEITSNEMKVDNKEINKNNEDDENDDEDVSFSELCIQIKRAINLTTEFEELTEARNILTTTEKWIQQVNEKCPQLKRKSSFIKDNKVVNLNINKLKTIQELENLLIGSDNLKFSLEKEKKHIHDAIARSKNWNIKAKKELDQILNDSLTDIVVDYKDLILLNASSNLPYHCFNGIDQRGESQYYEDIKKDEEVSYFEDDDDEDDDTDDKNSNNDKSKSNIDTDKMKEDTLVIKSADPITVINSTSIVSILSKTFEEIEAEKKLVLIRECIIWNKTKKVMDKFIKLLNESDEIGILDDVTLLIRSCCGVLQWIHQVKLLLGRNYPMNDEDLTKMHKDSDSFENDSYMSIFNNIGEKFDGLWGDISKNNISLLLKDGLALVSQDNDDDDVVDDEKDNAEMIDDKTNDKKVKEKINSFSGTMFASYGFDFARNIVKTSNVSSISSVTPASRRLSGSRFKSKVEDNASENVGDNGDNGEEDDDDDDGADDDDDDDDADDDDNKSVISINSIGSIENEDNKKRKRDNINWSEKLNTSIKQSRNSNSASKTVIKPDPVVETIVEPVPVVKNKRGGSKPGFRSGSKGKTTITLAALPATSDTKEVIPIVAKRKYKDRGSKYDKPTTTVTKEKEDIKNDIKLTQYLTHLVTYFDYFSISLPTIMKDYIDIFIRIICIHTTRMTEVDKWKTLYKKLTTKSFGASAGSNARKCKSEVTNLLAWAKRRHIETKAKVELEMHVIDCNNWVIKSNSIKESAIKNGHKIQFEDLKDFVKLTEKLLIEYPEMADMRGEIKKSKLWLTKYVKLGVEKGIASADELSELLEESESLIIDVSEQLDLCQAATKTYCLCRGVYHGNMVGCDLCDDWYHLQCIGITQSQADKTDKYNCLRCTLRLSIKTSTKQVADLANFWMVPDEYLRIREVKKQKISKKLLKEEKEIFRLQQSLMEEKLIEENKLSKIREDFAVSNSIIDVTTSITNDTTGEKEDISVDVNMSDTIDTASNDKVTNIITLNSNVDTKMTTTSIGDKSIDNISKIEDDVTSKMEMKIRSPVEIELDDAKIRYQKLLDELASFTSDMEREAIGRLSLVQWFTSVQKFIWPSNNDELIQGSPLGPSDPHEEHEVCLQRLYNINDQLLTTSINPVVELSEESSSNTSNNNNKYNNFNRKLLPLGVLQLVDVAIKNNIIDFSDVIAVIDSYRWLSWCSSTLHILRSPPTIKTYKSLLNITKYISSANIIDDKILKLISSIVSKGLIWKQKTRKLLSNSSKKIEITKISSLILDSSTIPMMSRLKDSLREILDRAGKEDSICHIISVNENKSNENNLWSMTSDDVVYSSGDDDDDDHIDISNNKRSKKEYNNLTYYSHAPVGESLWPVKLNIKAIDYKPASVPVQITQATVLSSKKFMKPKDIKEKDSKNNKDIGFLSESAMVTDNEDIHESINETSGAIPPIEATQYDKSIPDDGSGQASALLSIHNNVNNSKRKQSDIDVDNYDTSELKSKKNLDEDDAVLESSIKQIKTEKSIKLERVGGQNNKKTNSIVTNNNTTNDIIIDDTEIKSEKKLSLTISRKTLVQAVSNDVVIDESNNQVNKKAKK